MESVSNILLPKWLESAKWCFSCHSGLHGVTITFPHSLVALIPLHILWFQPTGLCSVPRHYLFSIHGWPTMLLPSSGVTFSSQVPISSSFQPLLSLCSQREAPLPPLTSTSSESVSSSIPLFLKEAFFLYQTPVAISTSPRSGPQGLGDLCISHSDLLSAWQLIFQKYLLDGGIRRLINVMGELT